jgi:hypothetical protein
LVATILNEDIYSILNISVDIYNQVISVPWTIFYQSRAYISTVFCVLKLEDYQGIPAVKERQSYYF